MSGGAGDKRREAMRRWRGDPVAFIEEVLVNPETGRGFVLYEAQKRFLREAFVLTDDGRFRYSEMVFSAPKKSGKTALAAMAAVYVAVVLAGQYGEVYCLANDFEQAASRVFQAAARIVEASPLLRGSVKITANRIEFRSTGTFIQAVASDYAGFAGANPTLVICDELWGFMSEAAHRLWDEAVPSPARRVSGRLTVTYAGFEGESVLLEGLYKRGMGQREIAEDMRAGDGILMYWTHAARAPWQTGAWLEEMRRSLRRNQYLRMIENRWVTRESTFIDLDWWDACVDPGLRPCVADRSLAVWVGLDASVKRDSTAIVAVTWDAAEKRVRLVWHRVFQPRADDQLDFEATIERTLLELRERFNVREIRFDPYQLVAVAQRLQRAGLPMIEFSQTVANLTEAGTNLYELVKGRNLRLYADAEMRLAVSRCVAIETARGWRIGKEKQSHKIDVVVALAFACLGAARAQQSEPGLLGYYREMSEKLERGEDPFAYDPGENELIQAYREVAGDSDGVGPLAGRSGEGIVVRALDDVWRRWR